MGNNKRVKAGVPAGGQFDTHERAEAAIELNEPPVFDEINTIFRGQKFFTAAMKKWPALYSTEGTPVEDKIIVGHYFGGPCDWYIAEYDPHTGRAFGYTDLGQGGEWGYIDLREVEAYRNRVNGVPLYFERDANFRRDVAWNVIPELKEARAADTISLGTAPARELRTDQMIDTEVELRAGERELRDATALAIARSFGDEHEELRLLGGSGHGSRKKAYAELSAINENRHELRPTERARLDAMFTWLLNGGDND